jgi:hypothetical protein
VASVIEMIALTIDERGHRNHTKSDIMNGREVASRVRPRQRILGVETKGLGCAWPCGATHRKNGEEDGANGDKEK